VRIIYGSGHLYLLIEHTVEGWLLLGWTLIVYVEKICSGSENDSPIVILHKQNSNNECKFIHSM
jgi:hypothetical protein